MSVIKRREIVFFFPHLIKVYDDDSVERLVGVDVEPCVFSKDVNNIIPETPEVYVRIYIPQHILTSDTNHKLPLLVYFHGGAFMVNTPASSTYHNYLNTLVAKSNIIAVSVNYRKAPEHPLPIAYDDSWAAFRWVASHRNRAGPEDLLNRHADFGRLFLSGDSSGGNIAHNMAMKPDVGEILGLALVDPHFWGSDTLESEYEDPDMRAHMDKLWPYLTDCSIPVDDPRDNPTFGGWSSLDKLGSSWVLLLGAEKDILRDRGKLYAKVLREGGWKGKVKVHQTKGEDHVFHLIDPRSEKAKKRMTLMADFFNTPPLAVEEEEAVEEHSG